MVAEMSKMTEKRLDVGAHRYLIIGGTTKAATTSLFAYISDHPEVCPANFKETRFFLDEDYPLPSAYCFSDGLKKYERFYTHCHNRALLVEATPDYLYSVGTARRLKNSLARAKVFFVLREPSARLRSWYRFSRQCGLLPAKMDFDEYVRMQRNTSPATAPQHLRTLAQGRYSRYISEYFELFGRNRVHVAFYEELADDPVSTMRDICTFSGISPSFYDKYDFRIYNYTRQMRNPALHRLYMMSRYSLRKLTHDKPRLHRALRNARLFFDYLYLGINEKSRCKEDTEISSETLSFLCDYYGGEAEALEKILGRTPPW